MPGVITTASVGSEFHREIVHSGRLSAFLFFVALLGTFAFIRTSTWMIRKQVSWWPGNVYGRRHPRPSPGLGDLRDDDLRVRRRGPPAGIAVVGDRHRLLRDRHGPGAGRVRPLGRAQGRLLGEGRAQVDRRDDHRRVRGRRPARRLQRLGDARGRRSRAPCSPAPGRSGWSESRSRWSTLRRRSSGGRSSSLVFWPAGVVAAFRLAKPHSIWARRFYRDGRLQASEARYGVAGADETPGSGDSGAPAADSAPPA